MTAGVCDHEPAVAKLGPLALEQHTAVAQARGQPTCERQRELQWSACGPRTGGEGEALLQAEGTVCIPLRQRPVRVGDTVDGHPWRDRRDRTQGVSIAAVSYTHLT